MGTQAQVLALDTFIKLTRAADAFGSRLASYGTIGDLTPTQFGVLESFYQEQVTLGRLCRKLGRKERGTNDAT